MSDIKLTFSFAYTSRGSIKSQMLYAVSQGLSFIVIAIVFYVGCLWITDGRYGTADFYTVLTSVVSTLQISNQSLY